MKEEEVHFGLVTPEELLARRHPRFRGTKSHLTEFLKLASSPPRSDERQVALGAWADHRRISVRKKVGWKQRTLAVDLTGADLKQISLGMADLRLCTFDDADLRGSSFKGAVFQSSSLRRADLRNGRLLYADFRDADLTGADLRGADLTGANLTNAKLVRARLNGANLEFAQVIRTDLRSANLTGCRVYGTGAWDIVESTGTRQSNLVLQKPEPDSPWKISIDDFDVAQFVHLFLDPRKIHQIIATTTDKLVLILGRFSEPRKRVLDEIRRCLPDHDHVGVLFDFEFLDRSTMLETVLTLAQMSRFTLADLTGAKLVVHEVRAILERLSGQIVQPIRSSRSRDIPELHKVGGKSRNQFLPTIVYRNRDDLIEKLGTEVLPAVDRAVADLQTRDKFTL